MLPPCSCTWIRLSVGLPGPAPPPHLLLYALYPRSSSIRLESVSTHVNCQIRFGGRLYVPVSGALVALPPTIQPSGVCRHAERFVPTQAAPEHPRCSSQNAFSLLRSVICHVRRSARV